MTSLCSHVFCCVIVAHEEAGLPLVDADRLEPGFCVVEVFVPGGFVRLAGPVVEIVDPVDVVPVLHVGAEPVTCGDPLTDVGHTGGRGQRR
ncbi:MAG: hypothetical protein KBB53_10595, partial [Steroidobacteraceae bacterium]|nr:hypothetical protein [Steroidobacteraceae bacterium]